MINIKHISILLALGLVLSMGLAVSQQRGSHQPLGLKVTDLPVGQFVIDGSEQKKSEMKSDSIGVEVEGSPLRSESGLKLMTTELGQVQIRKEGLPSLISIEGSKQALITKDCSDLSGNEDRCVVYAFNLDLETLQSPGAFSMEYGPLTITKPINEISGKLLSAWRNNEALPNVDLYLFRISRSGEPENYFALNLKNAVITEIKQYKLNNPDPSEEGYADLEDVTFAYGMIDFTLENGDVINIKD